jgi:hypothetical protein
MDFSLPRLLCEFYLILSRDIIAKTLIWQGLVCNSAGFCLAHT